MKAPWKFNLPDKKKEELNKTRQMEIDLHN